MSEMNNPDYTCGLSDEEMTFRFKEAIRLDEEKRTIMGLPNARYDEVNKKAYLEFPDGKRQYV